MERPVIFYDENCNLCQWLKKVFQRIQRGTQTIEWRHYDDAPVCGIHDTFCGESMTIQISSGKVYRGYQAVRELIRYTWLFPLRPLLYIPGIDWAGEKAYRLVARNRYQLFGKRKE